MKIYYLQEIIGFDVYSEGYVVDLGIVVVEFDMDGYRTNEFDNLHDFYMCWLKPCGKEGNIKKAKKEFNKHAMLTRVL